MGLRVRFQGGDLAGTVREFGDDRAIVKFGRKAGACDVVFPPSELRVSREHFALERVLGSYRLVTNHKSPVLVDGSPGHDGQILDVPCELQVGMNGPRVFVESDGEATQGHTVGEAVHEPDVHVRVETIATSERRNRLAAFLALALVAVTIVAGWLAVVVIRDRADRSSEIAMNALEKSEAARLESLENIDKSKLDFARVFERARRSVYLVAERITKGSSEIVSPLATAWSIGGGLLATNAHVAENFDPSARGAFFVRSCSDPPVDIPVLSVRIHPGYAIFTSLIDGKDGSPLAFDAAAASFLSMLPACDVALLEIAPEDAEKLGPALEIAPQAALEALAHGEPLGCLGFPSEGLIRAGTDTERPQPTAQTGAVTAVTDFFLSRAEPASSHLVQFSMSATGGSSGSPVLNRAGQVVAVLNGGNTVLLGNGVPRLPVGGINYGQRADLLRELVDPDSSALAAAQTARTTAWRAQHAAIFARGSEGLFIYLSRDVERQLSHRAGRAVELVEFFSTEARLEESAAGSEIRFEAPEDGTIVAIAVSGAPVDIDASIGVEGAVRDRDGETTYFPIVDMVATRGEKLVYRVWTRASQPAGGTPVRVRAYRVVES